jgi:hypothetical protein
MPRNPCGAGNTAVQDQSNSRKKSRSVYRPAQRSTWPRTPILFTISAGRGTPSRSSRYFVLSLRNYRAGRLIVDSKATPSCLDTPQRGRRQAVPIRSEELSENVVILWWRWSSPLPVASAANDSCIKLDSYLASCSQSPGPITNSRLFYCSSAERHQPHSDILFPKEVPFHAPQR